MNNQGFFPPMDQNDDNVDTSIKLSPDNYVTVRVWYPKIDKKLVPQNKALFAMALENEGAIIGHTTLETAKNYVSLWPHPDANTTSAFKVYPSYSNSLEEDENDEEGKCNLLIRFYTLDSASIDTMLEYVQKTENGYVLTGSSSLSEKGGHSCCSIVYQLLMAGGIDALGAKQGSLMKSIAITPENLADYIITAKENELREYSATQAFPTIEGEFIPDLNKKSKCTIS